MAGCDRKIAEDDLVALADRGDGGRRNDGPSSRVATLWRSTSPLSLNVDEL